MPILGLLGTLLYFGCIFHAIKTGRINYWLMILIFLPGIGSLAYLLLEVLPSARDSRTGRKALGGTHARSGAWDARACGQSRGRRYRRQQAAPCRGMHQARPMGRGDHALPVGAGRSI